ncbi:MAG: hypothetical protein PWP31_1195 [Clostridia bacterium]|nr:hypothetical protein [Clostridia bacterium]
MAAKKKVNDNEFNNKNSTLAAFWPDKGNNILFMVAFLGLMILLFYPPFFRGLFFPVEQRWTLILAVILFWVTYMWKFSCQEISFLHRPLDYAALVFVSLYILAAISPASRSLAVEEVAKVLLYFLTYWLVSRLGEEKRANFLLHSLYLAAIGVSIAALCTATEIIYIKDGFLGGGRFSSTLQYPNALASYVAAGSIIGFYLWAHVKKQYKFLYGIANFLLLMVFLGTGSRGAYLVYPVALLGYLFFLPKGYRFNTVSHLIVTAISAMVVNAHFIPMALEKNYATAWSWFGLGCLVAIIGQLIIQVAGQTLGSPKVRWITAIAVLVVLVSGGVLFTQVSNVPATNSGETPGILNKLVSPQTMARIQDINLETHSSFERIVMTKDAIEMIGDRPLLGFGGGGWETAYRQYQDYFYNSTEVHNAYAQIAVETGILGFATIIIIWLLFLATVVKLYFKGNSEERLKIAAIAFAALSLGLHAAIDFDLSLGAVSIMLWALFGLACGIERQYQVEPSLPATTFKNKQLPYGIVVFLTTFIIIIFCGSFLAGVANAKKANLALQNRNYKAAVSYLEKASSYDPFNASYSSDLGQIYFLLGMTDKALDLVSTASNKEPYNLKIKKQLATIYWHKGNIGKAVEIMEESLQLGPWAGINWENLANVYASAGISYMQKGQQDKASELFNKVAALPDTITKKLEALGDLKKHQDAGKLRLTSKIWLRAGIGEYFLGELEKAENNFNKAAKDKNLELEAKMWKAILAFHRGDIVKANEIMTLVKNKNANLAKEYEQIKALPIITKR